MQPRASVYCNYDCDRDEDANQLKSTIKSMKYRKNDDIYKPSLDQATLVAGLAALERGGLI
jgi:hypothetical protein